MSKIKAKIKKHSVIDGATVVVGATISHGRDLPDMKSISAALGAATDHTLTVIPGALRVVTKSNFRSVVEAGMSLSKEAIPYVKDMEGFTALSSNVYMGADERMWTLENSADGKVLVRSHIVDDRADIEELMRSCSAVSASDNMQHATMKSLSSSAAVRAEMLEPSDVISFVRNGEIELGAVVYSESSSYHVLPYGNVDEGTVSISADQVINNFGDAQGNIEFPEDTTMTALSGNAKPDNLVDYYTKLYSHNQAFLDKLLGQIQNYAFCG